MMMLPDDSEQPDPEDTSWAWRCAMHMTTMTSAMRFIFTMVILVAGLWIAWHPVHAEMTKDNPPLSCQLLGGDWTIWSGWQCG